MPDKFSPKIMNIEHSWMKKSADAIKIKLMDISADSRIMKFAGPFIARETYKSSNKEKGNGGVKRSQMSAPNANYTSEPAKTSNDMNVTYWRLQKLVTLLQYAER